MLPLQQFESRSIEGVWSSSLCFLLRGSRPCWPPNMAISCFVMDYFLLFYLWLLLHVQSKMKFFICSACLALHERESGSTGVYTTCWRTKVRKLETPGGGLSTQIVNITLLSDKQTLYALESKAFFKKEIGIAECFLPFSLFIKCGFYIIDRSSLWKE